ncbi:MULTISPECIES: hypothetical protein [Nitrosomonas]|uniref:Uncharacterized protein n=1 Tax=Nitrosomonas communis TaxID=44574 RepID=A0A5D3YL50_9PROT|nr:MULTISPECIES: hypothetical protein [Nitrosomonas]TYP94479.1 hypothetical protein BCL69_10019 [Nitrosomonas communis]UVS62368.1 hypothetical protein NX761_04330 [Nitrosomonas sp. PLL12]
MGAAFKYIDIHSLQKILGNYYPDNLFSFAKHLDAWLVGINDHTDVSSNEEKAIPDRLLAHNLNKKNRPSFSLLNLDVNVVHTVELGVQRATTAIQLRFKDAPDRRRKEDQRVVLHILIKYPESTQWLISIPMQAIMKGWGDVESGYMGYSHSICFLDENGIPLSGESENGIPLHQHFYYGVTNRNWLKRMGEHLSEVRSGSNKSFHKAWREYQGRADVGLSSELVVLNLSYKEVMDWEELMVDECMAAGNSLNMIPGGFKGLKFLHEHRITDRLGISLEERERAINDFSKSHPRLGVPNLIVADLWKDEEYATRIICGAPGRLSVHQIREIRRLNKIGVPIERIA